jgi:hypothetical protein
MDLPSPITRTPSLFCYVMLSLLETLKKPPSLSLSLCASVTGLDCQPPKENGIVPQFPFTRLLFALFTTLQLHR